MDIDLSILRMLEREKEISFEVLVEAIEQALLTAYHKPRRAGARARRARPQDRPRHRAGRASSTRRATPAEEYDDTPDGFGRIAATTAKQIMLQRLRDAEDDIRFGEFAGKEGDIISGHHPAGPQPRRRDGRPRQARGDPAGGRAGAGRGVRPRRADQVPGRLGAQGHARAADHAVALATPTWSRSSSPSRCPRSPTAPSRSPAIAREAGHRTKIAVHSKVPGVNAKGACIGPMGQRVRNVMASCTARRSTSSTGPRTRPSSSPTPCRRRGSPRWRSSTSAARSCRVVVPDFQLSLAIGKEGQNARLAARLTGWRIDIRSDEAPDPDDDDVSAASAASS